MKKILPAILIVFTLGANAQTIIYNEDFTSGIPTNMTMIKNPALTIRSNLTNMWASAGNTVWVPSNYGLIPPTDNLAWNTAWYDPAGIPADDWLITPAITLTDNNILYWEDMSVNINNPYFPYDVKISTSSSDTSDFQLLGTFYGQNQRPDDEILDLSAYANQTVYIAFHNHAFEQFLITIDSITVIETIGEDIVLLSTNIGAYAEEGIDQYFSLDYTNRGHNTITSLKINYQVDSDPIVTETINGLNMELLDSASISFSTPWTASGAGSHSISTWISDINGTTTNSNTLSKTVTVLQEHFVKRKTLLEGFSSASCIPCRGFNINRVAPILNDFGANEQNGQVTAIKYQLNYPTAGVDPSYNSDAQNRSDFYSVGSIPTPVIDGTVTTTSLSALINYKPISEQLEQPSYISMNVGNSVVDSTVTVSVGLHPHKDIASNSLKLYIAVIEKHYDFTGGTNGEVEFHNVMRKMLPDANGIALGTLTTDSVKTYNENYTFTMGNVTLNSFNLWEDMDNISVVAFIQDTTSLEVYQSEIGGCAHDAVIVQTGPLYSSAGDSIMLSCNIDSSYTYQWELNGTPITGATNSTYYANQSGSYNVIITNNGCEQYSETIDVYFSVGMNENSIDLILVPNPTQGIFTVKGTKGIFTVYNMHGQLITKTTNNIVDISDASNGVYFMKVIDKKGQIYFKKLVKN